MKGKHLDEKDEYSSTQLVTITPFKHDQNNKLPASNYKEELIYDSNQTTNSSKSSD
jgi:hypothetical protein